MTEHRPDFLKPMVRFLNKIAGGWILLLLILTILATGLARYRGGSAAVVLAGQRATSAEILEMQGELQQDKIFIFELAHRFSKIIQLDFGETIRKEPILPLIFSGFQITLLLSGIAALGSLIYGVGLAVLANIFTGSKRILIQFNYLILSTPVFIIALFLLVMFALYWPLLPPGGTQLSGWMILPALSLGSKTGCRLFLFADEFFEREYSKQYVKTARAYGMSRANIIFPWTAKNIALPVLNYWLIDFASYLAGAAIVESIFSIPGIGYLLLQSLHQYDTNLMLGILIMVSLAVYSVSIAQEALDHWYKRYSGK